MGIPTSEVGYTSATTRREVHDGHVVALENNNNLRELLLLCALLKKKQM
jgi:hypothetical protein